MNVSSIGIGFYKIGLRHSILFTAKILKKKLKWLEKFQSDVAKATQVQEQFEEKQILDERCVIPSPVTVSLDPTLVQEVPPVSQEDQECIPNGTEEQFSQQDQVCISNAIEEETVSQKDQECIPNGIEEQSVSQQDRECIQNGIEKQFSQQDRVYSKWD